MNENPHFLDTYSRSDLFVGIAPEKLGDIFCRGHRCLLGSGESLFHEGDPALKCYFVLKGRLKLVKLHEQGKEAILRYIDSGELTAAVSVFQEKDYPVTAIVVGDAEVVGWDKDTMLKLMLEYAPLAVNMLGFALDRIDELQTRYLELCAEQVEQRVARALLRIMRKSSHETSTGVQIDFRLSRKDLADYTGTTQYTVSRTLSFWEKKAGLSRVESRLLLLILTPWSSLLKLVDRNPSPFFAQLKKIHLVCASAKTPEYISVIYIGMNNELSTGQSAFI